jgi:hypothetical protein
VRRLKTCAYHSGAVAVVERYNPGNPAIEQRLLQWKSIKAAPNLEKHAIEY